MIGSLVPVSSVAKAPSRVEAGALLVRFAYSGDDGALADSFLKARDFKGGLGQVVVMPTGDAATAVVGLGDRKLCGVREVSSAGAAAARARGAATRLIIELPSKRPTGVSARQLSAAVVDGLLAASVRLPGDKDSSNIEEIVLVGASSGALDAARKAEKVARYVDVARALANAPSRDLTPGKFADRILELSASTGIGVEVMGVKELHDNKLAGLLAVGMGSVNTPRLVKLGYRSKKPGAKRVALVGKGVTFDSGGLSLKPAGSMETMKMDKHGAASVVGAILAAAELGLGVDIDAYVALAENMPSGTAQRPGDVITYRNQKTVEVLNTDAEGRLILADALILASETKPDAIVDLATLTGACMVALGGMVAGLMSHDDELANAIEAAAGESGEYVWRLPLVKEYSKMLESPFANLKNIGGPYGGAITAGLFLSEFVDSVPWAHLDIAGPAWSDADSGAYRKGATGFGVRTLVKWLEGL